MSIYSGFGTRAQEQTYDHCLDSILLLLQRRIVKFYRREEADEEKFASLILKLHHQLRTMEEHKYLQPKSSKSLDELAKILQAQARKAKTLKPTSEEIVIEKVKVACEEAPTLDETSKKKLLWVEKQPACPQTVEQETQTMGTIYDRKESTRQISSRPNRSRNAFSHLKDKYLEQINAKAATRDSLAPSNRNRNANRNKAKTHLRDSREALLIEPSRRKEDGRRRKTRIGQRMAGGEQDSEFQVGDIIRDYVFRVRRRVEGQDEGVTFE